MQHHHCRCLGALSASGTVYVGSMDSKLYAFTYSGSGSAPTVKWSLTTGGGIAGSPVLSADGSLVYVGSADKKLYAALVATGVKQWEVVAGGAIASSPALGGTFNRLYFGDYNGDVYAVQTTGSAAAQTASIQWTVPTGSIGTNSNIANMPAIAADGVTIYVGSNTNNLVAIKDEDTAGTVQWSFATGGDVFSAPAVAADGQFGWLTCSVITLAIVYFAVVCLSESRCCCALCAGTLYFGSWDSKVYALKDNGASVTKKWEFATSHRVSSTPTISANGVIYFGSHDASVYAITDDTTAAVSVWTYDTGSGQPITGSAAIDADGTVYIGSEDSNVYAIRPY